MTSFALTTRKCWGTIYPGLRCSLSQGHRGPCYDARQGRWGNPDESWSRPHPRQFMQVNGHYHDPATMTCRNCGVTDMELYYGRPMPRSGCQVKGARK